MSDALELGTIAVLGFGHQGEAQALNLRDAGQRVIVGARFDGAGAVRARAHDFDVRSIPEAVAFADLAAVLLPDEVVPGAWPDLAAARPAPRTWVFAHGFNLLYSNLPFDAGADVVLMSPTAPGRVLRVAVERRERIPAYLAVHRDGSGIAASRAERYAHLAGCGPLWRTTVREETEIDLFGEQTVLCGGMN